MCMSKQSEGIVPSGTSMGNRARRNVVIGKAPHLGRRSGFDSSSTMSNPTGTIEKKRSVSSVLYGQTVY